jgi:2-keto-3-deoxy-galactonokinase
LIAHDVAGALALAPTPGTITVIGSVHLATRYAQALKHLHRDAHIVDGGAASLAGLTAVHRQMVRVVL